MSLMQCDTKIESCTDEGFILRGGILCWNSKFQNTSTIERCFSSLNINKYSKEREGRCVQKLCKYSKIPESLYHSLKSTPPPLLWKMSMQNLVHRNGKFICSTFSKISRGDIELKLTTLKAQEVPKKMVKKKKKKRKEERERGVCF